MKKSLTLVLIIIALSLLGLGIWGYGKARVVEANLDKLKLVVEPTLVLREVSENDLESQIANWQILADKAVGNKVEIQSLDTSSMSDDLENNLNQFYDQEKVKVKLNEIKYLQELVAMQNKFQIAELDQSEMTKKELDIFKNDLKAWGDNISSSDLTLPPKYNQSLETSETNFADFLDYLNEISGQCETEDCQVYLETADFDNEVESFKGELKSSLESWVNRKKKKKRELEGLKVGYWLNPL